MSGWHDQPSAVAAAAALFSFYHLFYLRFISGQCLNVVFKKSRRHNVPKSLCLSLLYLLIVIMSLLTSCAGHHHAAWLWMALVGPALWMGCSVFFLWIVWMCHLVFFGHPRFTCFCFGLGLTLKAWFFKTHPLSFPGILELVEIGYPMAHRLFVTAFCQLNSLWSSIKDGKKGECIFHVLRQWL